MTSKFRYLDRESYNRIRSIEDGKVPPPSVITLHLPFGCPNKCVFCGINIYEAGRSYASNGHVCHAREFQYAFDIVGKGQGLEKPQLDEAITLCTGGIGKLRKMGKEKGLSHIMKEMDNISARANNQTIPLLPYTLLKYIDSLKTGKIAEENKPLVTAYAAACTITAYGSLVDATIPLGTYISLIDQAHELGVSSIVIAGFAEPMIHPDLVIPMMKRIKEKGMKGLLITSGSHGGKEILKTAMDIGWDEIILSIDASEPAVRKMLRNDSLDDVMDFIDMFRSMKKEEGAKIAISMNYIITELNRTQVLDALAIARDAEVQSIMYLTLWQGTGRSMEIGISSEGFQELKTLLEKNREVWEDTDISNNLGEILAANNLNVPTITSSPPDMEDVMGDMKMFSTDGSIPPGAGRLENAPCVVPWTELTITADGTPMYCCHSYMGYTDLNVQTNTLKEIWYSDQWGRLREGFLQGRPPYLCGEYCSRDEVSFQRTILKEYLMVREIMNEKKLLTGVVARFFRTVDNIIAHFTQKSPVKRWLKRMGYRLEDPF